MATLQKFKLLATQCSVISSPTRSPTTSPSPVIHIRRRKTLRMLLSGRSHSRRFHHAPPPPPPPSSTNKQQQSGVRLKLKDLFISSQSPPPPPPMLKTQERENLLPRHGSPGRGLVVARRVNGAAGGGIRPLSATLRQRLLLRRAWRPALVGIPETSP